MACFEHRNDSFSQDLPQCYAKNSMKGAKVGEEATARKQATVIMAHTRIGG